MHKAAGDAVIGGTVNMGGALRIRASRCAADAVGPRLAFCAARPRLAARALGPCPTLGRVFRGVLMPADPQQLAACVLEVPASLSPHAWQAWGRTTPPGCTHFIFKHCAAWPHPCRVGSDTALSQIVRLVENAQLRQARGGSC